GAWGAVLERSVGALLGMDARLRRLDHAAVRRRTLSSLGSLLTPALVRLTPAGSGRRTSLRQRQPSAHFAVARCVASRLHVWPLGPVTGSRLPPEPFTRTGAASRSGRDSDPHSRSGPALSPSRPVGRSATRSSPSSSSSIGLVGEHVLEP